MATEPEVKQPEQPLDGLCLAVLARNNANRDALMPSPPQMHPVHYYPTAQADVPPSCAFVLRCTDPGRVDLHVLGETNGARMVVQGALYMGHPDLLTKKNFQVASAGGWSYLDGATPPKSHLTAHARLLDKSDQDAVASCRQRQKADADREMKRIQERAKMIQAGLIKE